jgi:nucleoside-diphosphate-sugar epimerase
LAVSGEQKHYGDRLVTEDDFRHGHVQYAMHKIFNEWQAQDYREKHGMEITAIRPANVTGPDKIVGSVDHVFCITDPARAASRSSSPTRTRCAARCMSTRSPRSSRA